MSIALPDGFVLGASTSAPQIEGSAATRGRSIWDTFAAQTGRVADASTPSITCDHVNRMDDDVALMADLGLQGYRFSIAWPRVQPEGVGPADGAGLDFYDRLVDALLSNGIAPMATLYHWDLPQALHERGGWASRETVDAFAGYTALVADRLADRVAYWCPVNEPAVQALSGYALGVHAPGERLLFGALAIIHHQLLAHGRAVQVLRGAGASAVGTANNHTPVWVAGEGEEDHAAAALYDAIHNGAIAQPTLAGGYPDILADLVPVADGDLDTIAQPLDFYGVNYYNPTLVGRAGRISRSGLASGLEGEDLETVPLSILDIEGFPVTDMGWPVVPAGLHETLTGLARRYPGLPPVHITENGCAHASLDDTFRIDYLDSHLRAVTDAIADGVDVRGYWTWSLLDNWEWADGFEPRFGLVHVDYETQTRTPRASAGWYRDLIAAQTARP